MRSKQLLRYPTKAEVAGYQVLDMLNVRYIRQPSFAGKFVPDAAVPSSRLIVQFDGDYWHDRLGVSTELRVRKRVALDRSQDAYMRSCGWEVVRLWESELHRDPHMCADRISRYLRRLPEDEISLEPLVLE